MIISETLFVFGAALVSFCFGMTLDAADWFPPVDTLGKYFLPFAKLRCELETHLWILFIDNFHFDSKHEENCSQNEGKNEKSSNLFIKCMKIMGKTNA